MSQEAKPSVTVFGAGVAGLTAAHELAERGFLVEVVDPDIREVVTNITLDRGLGGMARSQWACELADVPRPRFAELLKSTDFLVDDVIVFDEKSITRTPAGAAQSVPKPLNEVHADTLIRRAAELLDALVDKGLQPNKFTVVAPVRKADDVGKDTRVDYVLDQLRRRRRTKGDPSVLFPLISDLRRQIGTNTPRSCTVYFECLVNVFPGEHGFRFFPAFYRHVFDTMRRIPITNPRPHERVHATVCENLTPCEAIGFARGKRAKSFSVPRGAIKSIESLVSIIKQVLTELEYTLEDIDRFGLSMVKYATSSTERRRRDYEHMSWGKFIEAERYSEVSRRHIEYAPQMLASLRGSQTDARTQGNITLQLLLDQFRTNFDSDRTLNGPTSSAWFDHWHDYLRTQGVTFVRGKLVGFQKQEGRLLPVVEGLPVSPDRKYYVLALDLPGVAALADGFLEVAGNDIDKTDFERVRELIQPSVGQLHNAVPRGILQNMSGVQFYFDTEINFWRGHTLYMDSEWGLSSIAQPQFWGRRRDRLDGYRTILSVDIGIWDRAYGNFEAAWKCTPEQLARGVWAQIRDHHDDAFRAQFGDKRSIPEPIAYSVDANLEFYKPDLNGSRDAKPQTGIRANKTPFVVNRVGTYRSRPGRLSEDVDSGPVARQFKEVLSYKMMGPFVLAGTFMRTYTRITSMESANESARHAVNAILNASDYRGDGCEVWDPEDNEVRDLQWLKDVDARLVREERPHFLDILGCNRLSELNWTTLSLYLGGLT